MTPILNRYRRSLPARLGIWIVLFAAMIFIAALGYMFSVSWNTVRNEAESQASQKLHNTVLRVNDILDDVKISADNTDWLVYRHLDEPEYMIDLVRNVMLNNPILNGCSIAFEPFFFKEKGRYFSAYGYFEDGSVQVEQEGNEQYQYHYMDWYLQPKLLNQPCWTEPYIDVDVNDGTASTITSYCKPLTAQDGSFAGVLSVDISLSWLSETLSAVKPYPHSYCIMVGRGGAYLVHPDTTKLLTQTIFTDTLLEPDPEITALGKAMLRGEKGMKKLKIDGKDSYVFYEPEKETGWSVALVCPEKDVFGGFNRLRRTVIAIVLLGLLLMLFVCRRVINREMDPLRRLVRQADLISTGDFKEPLPDSGRSDEIGQLTQSFSNMQHSLVNYIDELKRTTASRERIEGELRIAREIQMAMVPRVFPPFPERSDIDLFAAMTPAKEVGGDLYDYFIQDGMLYLCIGDVSGKGIPGSLLMAVSRNLFRVVAKPGLAPDQIARQINETVAEDNEQMMFMTMFFGRIDLQTGRMDYCNCGHNPPVLIDGGKACFLDVKPNTPLGVDPQWAFEGESIADVRGRAFLFYTDGLNEAENPAHEQFGTDRMLDVLGGSAFRGAREAVRRMTDAVTAFVDGAEASDDLTLLCLKIRKS